MQVLNSQALARLYSSSALHLHGALPFDRRPMVVLPFCFQEAFRAPNPNKPGPAFLSGPEAVPSAREPPAPITDPPKDLLEGEEREGFEPTK